MVENLRDACYGLPGRQKNRRRRLQSFGQILEETFRKRKYSLNTVPGKRVEKFRLDGYTRDYSHNLGLSDQAVRELKRTIKTDLAPMIRTDEEFDLDKVLEKFNQIFSDKK